MFDRSIIEYYVSGLSRKYDIRMLHRNRLQIEVWSDRGAPFGFHTNVIVPIKADKDYTDDIMEVFTEAVRPILKLRQKITPNDKAQLSKFVIHTTMNVDDVEDNKYVYQLIVSKKGSKGSLYSFTVWHNDKYKLVQFNISPSLARSRSWEKILELARYLTLVAIMGEHFGASNIGDEIFTNASLKATRELRSEYTHVNYIKTMFNDALIPKIIQGIKTKELKMSKDGIMITLLNDGNLCIKGVTGFSKTLGLAFVSDEECRPLSEVILMTWRK